MSNGRDFKEGDLGYDIPPFWSILIGIFIVCLIVTILDWFIKK